MNRHTSLFHRVRLSGKALIPALLLVLLMPALNTLGSDRDLLRENRSKPYVFLLLDTSTSMNLAIDGSWVHAGGDDPRSRLYQAKEVLYEVFGGVDDVHFGFANFNQDVLQVQAKHWLYYLPSSESGSVAGSPISGYPAVELDDAVEIPGTDSNGDPFGFEVDIDGDMMTFGTYSSTTGGSCNDPITDREALNRFPKLGSDGSETTTTWFETKGPPRTYRIIWERSNAAHNMGDANLDVRVRIKEVGNCSSIPAPSDSDWEQVLTFNLWKDFLMWDDSTDEVDIVIDTGISTEDTGGYWDWHDVQGSYACGDSKPFAGGGWEGNYDTGNPLDVHLDHPDEISKGTVDTFCADSSNTASCTNNFHTRTKDDPSGFEELDRGDVLPFHWDFDNKGAFLDLINPSRTSTGFGQASYFEDQADATTGTLPVVTGFQKAPLIAAGNSPLGFALNDFRCWYRGDSSDNKCRNSTSATRYADGWENIAQLFDPDWQCRRPYFIIITDSEDNCPGNAPTAVIANLFSKSGIRTWAINVGTGSLNNIVQPGKGEEVKVSSRDELLDELRNILGVIQEEARSFASAAVPSVQADVADSIYLTQFTPLQDDAVWPGQVNAFLKPLPIDTTVDPPVPDLNHERHLWDAGQIVVQQQAPTQADLDALPAPPVGIPGGPYYDATDLRVGLLRTQRRVFYSLNPDNSLISEDRVPRHRALFVPDPITVPPGATGVPEGYLRRDLWSQLGLNLSLIDMFKTDAQLKTDYTIPMGELHFLFKETYVVKETTIGDPPNEVDLDYVMGDIFHSNPQIVGQPSNGRFLTDSTNFPGYEDFFQQQNRRRKVLVVGSNDGMLHFFDAGIYRADDPINAPFDGEFDNGTGTELAAYIPRAVMPSFVDRARTQDHQWGVDGTPAVADVRIDTFHVGNPDEDDREWRTALVGGLRRGGKSIYALDVTHPDPVIFKEAPTALGGVETGWVPKNFDETPSDHSGTSETYGGTIVPECVDGIGTAIGPPGTVIPCDGQTLPYPFPLWEFTDSDLQLTWSTPNIGAIRVLTDQSNPEETCQDTNGDPIACECRDALGNTVFCTTKYVAIFGSGMHSSLLLDTGPPSETDPYLYMVDIETGDLIYKRNIGGGLGGSAVATPAAVDTDQDGFIDRIYIGNTLGFMFRVDLKYPAEMDTCFSLGLTNDCVDDQTVWNPDVIFQTQDFRPIFFPPAVVFSAELGRYVLAFGTGNRENLWDVKEGQRFYTFVDDYDLAPAARTIADLTLLTTQVSTPGTDYLADDALSYGQRGWYLDLGQINPDDPGCPDFCDFNPGRERVITPATAISGLLSFSTFIPYTEVTTSGSGNNAINTCASRGSSRNYVMLIDNGDAIIDEETSGTAQRARGVDTLVSEPFVEQSQTQNPCDPAVEDCGTDPCEGTEAIAEVLKNEIFPPTCKFGNYRFNLSTMRADTGVECIAAIPVCVIEKNWKEFTGSQDEYDPSTN